MRWLRRWHRHVGKLLLSILLAVSFMAYLEPDFMLDVGTRIMLCF